jgi:hypothetical protein
VDQDRFDQLAVALSRAAHRRTLLAVLSGALLSAGLRAAPEAEGKGKKGQGKGKPQRHGKGKHQRDRSTHGNRDKRATAKATACPLCKRRDRRGRCVADPARNRQCCTTGSRRGFCLWGTCFAGPCGGPTCNDETCPEGCCDAAAQCHVNDDDACGTGGEVCAPCDAAGQVCQGGDCVCPSEVICSVSGCCPNASDVCNDDDQCCTRTTCAAQGKNCGTISDGCDGTLDCGGCPAGNTTPLCVTNVCTACSSSGECATAGLGNRCCGGACVTGNCCSSTECANPTPACANNTCATCLEAPNGTPCGTQSEPRGGTIRCYDGACPDPTCTPSGLTGMPCDCTGIICCAQGTICQGTGGSSECLCFFARDVGGKCGSDHDCSRMQSATACIGGVCQTPP